MDGDSKKEKGVEGSPVNKLTDDLLVEIISRVPYKSTCCCKCVSPRWRDLFSHPDHRKKMPQSLAGFFYEVKAARYFTNVSGKDMKPLGYLSVRPAEQGEGQRAEQREEQCSEEKTNSEECRGDAEEMHEVAEDAHVFHRPQKLPVSRKIVKGSSSMAGKSKVAEGKRNKGGEDESTSSDSDYEVDLEEEDNSSADDEEAIEFRKYARELKNKVRNKMLGEEDEKAVDVPEDFLVPEDCKLDDGDGDVTPYFDSADDLSYDEASDGDDMPKRKKTEHKVYDSTSEIPLFSVGMAFHDSREFKNALVKYGLKTYHHLLFPKDEKKRVSAKCSWPGCPWSIYGSITSRSDWLLVWRYNNEHTCIPRRDNKLVTCGVIAKKYFRQIRDNPSWKAEHIQQAVLQDLVADVSISKCKRAKKLVMEKIIDLSDVCSQNRWGTPSPSLP